MALNPLGLAPLILLVAIVGIAVYSALQPSFDRRLTRFARRLFGRYVSESPERERLLESAYIGETYRGYASRTFLFMAMGAIAGACAGAYATGALLLAIPAIVSLLMGLPRTMVNALGIRGFELVLGANQTLIVLIAGGIVSGIGTAVAIYLLRWELPKNTAAVRRRNIDEGMPRTLAFMYGLSRGGMSGPEIMALLAENQEIYDDPAREIGVAVREMELFGRDMISALQRSARRTPSETYKTFAENLASVLQSGQSLSSFLRDQYERHQEDAAERQADLLESLATTAEAYVTIFVAGVLFLITILLVFGLTTTDTLPFLQLLAYLAIPLSNLLFMIYLSQKLDGLGIGDSGTTDVLERVQTTTFGQPSRARRHSGVTDGGYVEADSDNWLRLRYFDRVKSIKRLFQSPLSTVLWNPHQILYLVVPVAVALVVIRAPEAFQTQAINLRILDDVVVQSTLLVLGSYALVRESYTRRIDRIESATPELLERLASLNEAGMSIVESMRRIRGNDLGVLSPEVRRIWTDIKMGANVSDALIRFGRRIRTTPITRVVTLLTHSMNASGKIGPVLRIAATQARADLRLRNRRRQQMLTYLVVIYISFFVFLVIIVAVQEVLVPSLPSNVPTPDSSNRLGVGVDQFARFGQVNKAAYTLVFFHTALIQAALTGFVGGQLGEGTLKDGVKHAAIMLGIAYLAFVVLSSPVASLTITQPTVDGGEITVDSASLSSGGYVVVHQFDASGEVVGVSTYLEAGTHKDVSIQLDKTVSAGTQLVFVVHQETNDNRQLDYDFETPGGSIDEPYAASGKSEYVTVRVTVQ